MKRVISVLICILLCFSMFGCFREQEDPSQKAEVDPEALYSDIISQYTVLLTAKHNGETLPKPDTSGMERAEAAIAEALYGIVEGLKDAQSAETMGYGFKDMDGNGIPELFLFTQYAAIRAVFTISEDAPVLLESCLGGISNYIYFVPGNRFFIVRSPVNENIEEATYCICRVAGDKMAYDSVYGAVYDRKKNETVEYYQTVDGNRVTIGRDDFDKLNWAGKKVNLPEYSTTCKLLAPRIHFPLKDTPATDGLPVADFSSYAAIRETYQKISAVLEKFSSVGWFSGEYDDLFSIPDDQSFEIYKRLLFAAYHGSDHTGYDEIDINGDGQDELVLMNEDYRIKAIFTQKNGIPLLLDAFSSETCWLDGNGLIHVDNERSSELEYSLYEFTKNGNYNLRYSILVTDNGNRYRTRDGKTESITFDESMELYYNDYCRYSESFAPNEQTRNVSSLTYTPLNESTGSLISQAENQIWRKNAKLEKTTGKDLAYSNTDMTFESVNNTQIKVSVQYHFTYSYPDPNRENYLLDDTTESSLELTAAIANGVAAFEEHGIKGRIEFGHKFVWVIIDESTDSRFPVGHHCYEQYSPNQFIN